MFDGCYLKLLLVSPIFDLSILETLFVALQGGDILKCSTLTNPATIVARWSYPEEKCK